MVHSINIGVVMERKNGTNCAFVRGEEVREEDAWMLLDLEFKINL